MRREEHKHRNDRADTDEIAPEAVAAGVQRREKLDDDTESVLDEIDDVLEEDAESFVRSYVQKGGE